MLKKSFLSIGLILVALLSLEAFAVNSDEVQSAARDTTITTKVKAKLLAGNEASPINITVETQNGVVKLIGDVSTKEEASAAIDAAYATEGVKDVDTSRLTIASSAHPVSDAVITSKVKTLFLKEKLFGNKEIALFTIHVDTQDGVVRLYGTTDNVAQAKNAVKLAHTVKGVKNVRDEISVTHAS